MAAAKTAIEFHTEKRRVKDLIPAKWNPRRLTDEQAKHLKASLNKFSLAEIPVINTDNMIIAGHQRVKLLSGLKGNQEIDVRVPNRPLTEEEVREYNIRSNANTGEWDFDILANEFEIDDLHEWGLDIDFKVENDGLTDPDELPELVDEPISKLGDLWILGNHRIICGDSTEPDTVDKLLNGVKPHLMVTDPPYGVNYDASWRNNADRANGKKIGARAIGRVENDDKADWREAWALFPGNIAYVWHGGLHSGAVAESLESCDFQIRAQIIWAKNNFAISRGDYHWKHEPCWYAVKGKGNWMGDRSQTTLWEIDKPLKSETGHSTQKPVECMRRPMENNSSPGQAVYEPFSGSGTTIIAAEQTGRHCYAIELNPAYVDMAIERWQNFTGKEAILESGKKFSELRTARE